MSWAHAHEVTSAAESSGSPGAAFGFLLAALFAYVIYKGGVR